MQNDQQQQSSQPQAQHPQADLKTRKLNLLYQAHKQVMQQPEEKEYLHLKND